MPPSIARGVSRVVTGSLVLLLGLSSCPGPSRPPDPGPTAGGVARLATALVGPAAHGRAGDLLLEEGDLRLVVASEPGDAGRIDLGSILEVVVGGWEGDELRDLIPAVFEGERALPSTVLGVDPDEVGGRPAIRIRQAVSTPPLSVETVVRLVDGEAVLLESTLRASAPAEAIAIGDRLRFHGAYAFAPGAGFFGEARPRHRAPWVAHRGRSLSYALAFPSGEADLEIHFDDGSPTEIEARGESRRVEPSTPLVWRRFLLVQRGGLETVAGSAWTRAGVPVFQAGGEVAGANERASVTALSGDRPVLTSHVGKSGSFAMPLPAGSYRLVLEAPGGADETTLEVGEAGARVGSALRAPRPSTLRAIVTDGQDPIPARVALRGVAPTADPSLGTDELARGNGNTAFTATGEMDLELPAGRYDVIVSRGPEYSVAHERVEVTEDRGATVRARLDRVVDARDWVACDLHLHASPSFDSRVSLVDRVTGLLAEGVRFAAATDHNHVTDYAPAVEVLGAEARIATAAGVEITTKDWGHFNAYPYPADALPPPHAELLPADLFGYVRRVAPDAIVQVNHPRLGDLGYFNRVGLDSETRTAKRAEMSLAFDALEIFNGFDLGNLPRVEGLLEEWFRLLEHGDRFVAVGSSDSHKITHHWAGYPRTYVWVDGAAVTPPTPAAITAALRAGRAFVTNGPLLELTVDGQRPGATLEPASGEITVRVEVRAAPGVEVDTLELVVGGARRAVEPTPGEGSLRLLYEAKLAVSRDTWVVAIARGSRPLDDLLPGSGALPLAFTNPVYVRAKE